MMPTPQFRNKQPHESQGVQNNEQMRSNNDSNELEFEAEDDDNVEEQDDEIDMGDEMIFDNPPALQYVRTKIVRAIPQNRVQKDADVGFLPNQV